MSYLPMFNFSFDEEPIIILFFDKAGLPVLTLPFVITSSIFLAVTSGIGKERLAKAPDGRPPEYQRKRHTKAKMNSNNPSDV